MKSVLHVIDTTGPGGAEVVFIELADRLRERGYRSVPLIRGPGWVQDTLLERGLEPLVHEAKGSFNLPFLRRLIEIIRTERIGLVQSHLLGSNVYCALAGLLTRTPVVATFHGTVDLDRNERMLSLKRLALRLGTSRFVAVSGSLAHSLANSRLLRLDDCSIIFNGIDSSRFPAVRTGWLRRQIGLPPDARLAVSVGNVRPAKAYDVLCRAAAILRPTHPELHFAVAGAPKSSLMRELDALSRSLGVTDRVHFVGFVPDPATVLAEGDLFVLSSTTEGFSIATLEAFASGLPSVITACGGPQEIATPDVHALMPAPGDPAALAQAIVQLLEDAPLRSRLASAGQQLVRERFDIGAMVDAYAGIYAQLQSPRGGSH